MENILVSVIVPVYNEKRYLLRCVESITTQSYSNLEIILVDDGSTDGTSEDCDELALNDNRIKVIHKSNEGLSSARLTGLEAACGGWIMFVDDDDILSPYAISTLLKYIDDRRIDIVTAGRIDTSDDAYYWDKEENAVVETISGIETVNRIPGDKQSTIITPLWGKLYKTSFIKSIDLYRYKDTCPTIYFEDVLMTPIIYSKANLISIVHKILYLHREVSTSISRSGKLGTFYYEQIYSGSILLDYCKNICVLKPYYDYQLKIYLGSILRIWALSNSETLNKYRQDILNSYKKYIADYLKYSDDKMYRKFLFRLFSIWPDGWRFFIRLLRRI